MKAPSILLELKEPYEIYLTTPIIFVSGPVTNKVIGTIGSCVLYVLVVVYVCCTALTSSVLYLCFVAIIEFMCVHVHVDLFY